MVDAATDEGLPVGETTTATYRTAPDHGASTGSLPSVGATATQDLWMEVALPGSPGTTGAQATGGMAQGQQYAFFKVATAGVPYFPPE